MEAVEPSLESVKTERSLPDKPDAGRKPESPAQEVDWSDFRDHIATADQDGRRQWMYPRKVQRTFFPLAHLV